ITFPKGNVILKKGGGDFVKSTDLSFTATVEKGLFKDNEWGYEVNERVKNKQNPYFLIKVSKEYSIKLLGNLSGFDPLTLSLVDVEKSFPEIKKIFESVFEEVSQKKIKQAKEKAKQEEAQKAQQEAIKQVEKLFKEAQESLKTANNALQEKLTSFNKDEKNVDGLLKSVKQVQEVFKKLESEANKEALQTEISQEFKDQKLYADFLDKNLKEEALDKQSDYMKGLSGQFYKPYERLLNILESNKNNNKISDKDNLITQLKALKDKGFALSAQIESNLETFFDRLQTAIKKDSVPKPLKDYCKEVSLTLNGDTGTGKTMFIESLLGSTDEKNKYFTNQEENGDFKKEGLGDLGALIYGKDREKFVIHCGQDFETIKKQINAKQDAILAFDEWHLLDKKQKEELRLSLKDKNVIKITATPTDGLYKALKKGEENDKAKKAKQKFVSEKEARKNKVLENVATANSDISTLVSINYCLSIIDAENKVFQVGISNHQVGTSYEFADIFGKNLEGITFSEVDKQKPEFIILPPDKDGKNVIYTLNENKQKYTKKEVNKNELKTALEGKKRVFQVFGPSNQEEAKNSRGNIDGGDNGTASIANPKILFYSLDQKIVEEFCKLAKKNNITNEDKAKLVDLINKYDEFIVQAYGRARANTTDITFKDPKAKELHHLIQAKKQELLKDDAFKTMINDKQILVNYKSFVDRFNKNLPEEEREKIISQAFLKVASKEDNKKEGSLKVEIEAIKDQEGDTAKRFNEAYNIIKSLSKEQREVLMEVGGYDQKGLLEKQDALAIIQASIKAEIEAKRGINKINDQNYSDFREQGKEGEQGFQKIEEKIKIKIDKDGKVSLEGAGGVDEGKFKSKEYFDKNKDKELNEVDANAFKVDIKEHIKEINKKEEQQAKENLRKTLELDTKLSKEEVSAIIKGFDNSVEAQAKLESLQKEKTNLETQKAKIEEKLKALQEKLDSNVNVSEENKGKIEKELQQQLEQQLKDLETQQKQAQEQQELLKTQLETQQKQAQEQQELLKTQLETQQQAKEKEQLTQQQLEESQRKLEEAQQKLSQAQQEARQKLADLETLNNQLRALQEQLKQKGQQIKQIRALQEQLKQKDQQIKQMEQNHSQKEGERDKELKTQADLNRELEVKIAEITRNKRLDSNIDALFDGKNLKELYHTAKDFNEIGQANLDFDYKATHYVGEYILDFEDEGQSTSKSAPFETLRKSIIQSSAIRDKHLILQEVLQEKGLMNDGLKAYGFKSLDQLIDGDNFKDEFKADLERLGFVTGEGGIWTKVEGDNVVKYDTNQPYVKDFLINAYYEENFKQFQETLQKEVDEKKLTELEASAVERYNAKQKLEFVKQINNYNAVVEFNKTEVKGANIGKNKLNDYIQIADIITNKNQNYQERFKSEHNEEIQKLEKSAAKKGTKIEVGASASLLVNVNDKNELEDIPDERDVVNKVPTLLKINNALLYMIGKNDTNQKTSDDSDLKTSNSTDENASSNATPGSLITPEGFTNLLTTSLVEYFKLFKTLVPSSDINNSNLLNNNDNNKNQHKL
ncbi:MAG: hypothetical protein LW595_04990, partial [Rickettsiales bacterium]|nr:hypothetical protein [Rickettsiales bacterium]